MARKAAVDSLCPNGRKFYFIRPVVWCRVVKYPDSVRIIEGRCISVLYMVCGFQGKTQSMAANAKIEKPL